MIFSNKVKVGDKVHYVNRITENGIIKEVVDNDYVRVVFNCDQIGLDFKIIQVL
jgi:hypothetical protein